MRFIPGCSRKQLHDSGVLLQLHDPNGTAAQKWKLVKDDVSGSYSIINSDSGKAVDVPGGNAVRELPCRCRKTIQRHRILSGGRHRRKPAEYEGTYTLASSKDRRDGDGRNYGFR